MSKATVLIVDDNPENLTVLGEVLRERYHVRAASSGARALVLAAWMPVPDLILLDVMMPGMNGYEVLRRLKERPARRATSRSSSPRPWTPPRTSSGACRWAPSTT
jgi:putative two-component system response regulator